MLLFAAYCAVAALVLFVPGLIVAAAAGLRGLFALGVAPAISVGLIGVGAVVLDKAHLAYSPLAVAGLTLITAVVAGVVTLLGRRLRPAWFRNSPAHDRTQWLWILGLLLLSSLVTVRYLRHLIPRSDVFAQGFDNLFHANAVQWMVQHHDASSLAIGAMTSGPNPPEFYPAAWHGVVTLVLMILPHADVSIGINATTFAEVALVWPVGLFLLTRVLLPFSRVALAATGALCFTLPAFPLRLLQWGPLYPNVLALVLTPAFVALVVALFRAGLGRYYGGDMPLVLGAVGATVGVAVAHPSQVPLLLLFADSILLWWWLGRRRDRRATDAAAGARQRDWPAVALLALAAIGTLGLWIVLRPNYEIAMWPAVSAGNWDLALVSLADMAGGAPTAASLVGGGAVALGIYAALRRRILPWLLTIHGVLALIFMYNFVHDQSPLRYWISGTWYSDHHRLAALLVISGIPLGVLGVWHVAQAVQALRAPAPERSGRLVAGERRFVSWLRRPVSALLVGALALGLFTVALTRGSGFRQTAREAMLFYSTTYNGELLDDYERQMFRELPAYVPADETIATSPWNGSSMAYGATGRKTTTTHVWYTPTADVQLINVALRRADRDPAVCPAVRRLNVHWALDFGKREILGANTHTYPGLTNLDQAEGFEPVLRIGDKVLYHVSICWN